MGINGFHKWLAAEYDAYYSIRDTKNIYHHLYIDLNYLLHLCHYNSNNETHLINKMSVVILEICRKVCPLVSVNLFCDGTAPFAKMIVQRERRNKDQNISDDIFKTSLNFTPGTKFIQEISIKLDKCIRIIRTYFAVKVSIDSIAPGEAEIKIKDKLIQNYIKNNEHEHLLVTNDADVVLILAASDAYKKSNILLNDKVLSMNALLREHFKKYNSGSINNLDFVFLNLFLGNDYIPKIREISPNKIWEAYSHNVERHKYIIKINNNDGGTSYDFNRDFVIDILNDCVGKIGKTKIIKNNKFYNDELYRNYFDGVIWTLTMYNSGRCCNYGYICCNTKPIDILNLLLFMYKFNIDQYRQIESSPIPSILCGILLLPENAVNELIDSKYKEFINNKETKKIYNKDFLISVDFIKNIQVLFEKYQAEL